MDEVDRADDGFEAFLLEVLSDFQVTIPELGTIRAEHVPYVVLTSNRSREIGDALRRRCLYLYIEHPSLEKEVRIIRSRVPGASERLSPGRSAASCRRSAAGGCSSRRASPRRSTGRRRSSIFTATISTPRPSTQTLGCLLKDRHDMADLSAAEISALLAEAAGAEAPAS